MNRPRGLCAHNSPNGLTRFCSGMNSLGGNGRPHNASRAPYRSMLALRPPTAAREDQEGMARIPILDRTEMNAEQGRVYDAAKEASGIVGGPYYAYIRLPKL